MKKLLIDLIIVAAALSWSTSRVNGAEVDFPCKLTDYRILKRNEIMVRCDGVRISNFTAEVSLYKMLDESVVYPAVATGTGSGPLAKYPFWLKFTFVQPFAQNQDYELRFSGSYQIQRQTAGGAVSALESFKPVRFRFSTSSELNIANPPGPSDRQLRGHSAVQVADGAKLIDKTNATEYSLEPGSTDLEDPDAAGVINLVPEPSTLGKKLEVRGVTDIFNQQPTVKEPKAAPPPVAPKTKQAANWYFNFLHQAGEGIKPTWITDIKITPVIGGLPGRFYITPSLIVDTGNGKVGDTKTNDIINPKFGVSRLVRTNTVLNAIKFSPSISYETNRARDKRNLLFDGNVRLFFSGFENNKAQRSQDAFLRARLQNANILPQDVPEARFGYSIKLFFGTELGKALTDNEAKSSDESSKITVPKYQIARFRPQFSSTFEFWRVATTISVYPRFLFSTENVTREIDTPQADGSVKKTIVLHTVSGWRPYGELSVSYAFDHAGHYALNSVYKFGSQPPNFDHTNIVQSGVVFRF